MPEQGRNAGASTRDRVQTVHGLWPRQRPEPRSSPTTLPCPPGSPTQRVRVLNRDRRTRRVRRRADTEPGVERAYPLQVRHPNTDVQRSLDSSFRRFSSVHSPTERTLGQGARARLCHPHRKWASPWVAMSFGPSGVTASRSPCERRNGVGPCRGALTHSRLGGSQPPDVRRRCTANVSECIADSSETDLGGEPGVPRCPRSHFSFQGGGRHAEVAPFGCHHRQREPAERPECAGLHAIR